MLGQLYFTENSRDWLSEDVPEDKLNRLTQPGKDDFGFPYCHQGNIPGSGIWVGALVRRIHQADRTVGAAFSPARYAVLYGQHVPFGIPQCHLRRTSRLLESVKKFGGDIALVSLNENGTVKSVDPFITGFIENNNYLGRPADLLVLKDGSMLISDDFNGAVYRVTYDGASVGR